MTGIIFFIASLSIEGPLHKAPGRVKINQGLLNKTARASHIKSCRNNLYSSFVHIEAVKPDHMLLKSVSTAVGLITNRAKIFTNHMLGLDMPECVCLLDVTIIALATKPN